MSWDKLSQKEKDSFTEFVELWENIMNGDEHKDKTKKEKHELIEKIARRQYKLHKLLDD